MPHPKIVTPAQWQSARAKLLAKEKKATRLLDSLAAERRRLPMVRIAKDYTFTGPNGKIPFKDLFQGRNQLVLYHFMFAPSVHGWPDAGCPGCSLFADSVANLAHIEERGISFAMVSLAPSKNIERYQKRMGWKLPWVSSAGNSFNRDFGLSTPAGESFGLSVFLRLGDEIYRTYFTTARGVETLTNTHPWLDVTPFGRQEEWESSPKNWPQRPTYSWVKRHDEYEGRGKKKRAKR